MAEGMHRLNVQILDGDNQLTYWTGTPSQEGGALKGIDMSPVGGPPIFDYDPTGNDREQIKFNVDTKIPGNTPQAREAFIAKYARGTTFEAATISGVPAGIDWVVENALVKHSDEGSTPSILTITLAEIKPNGVGGSGSGSG